MRNTVHTGYRELPSVVGDQDTLPSAGSGRV